MQRVVTVFRIQSDFDVILLAVIAASKLADLVTEIALYFQD